MSEEQTTTEERGQPPLQTLRDRPVFVKLWRQESQEHGSFVTATIGRTYKDEATGEFRESRSLSPEDMLKAQALINRAHPEALKWREYFWETNRQKRAPEPEKAEPVAERDAALQQQLPGSEAVPEAQPPTMAQQRDAAMANAAPATSERGPSREPQR